MYICSLNLSHTPEIGLLYRFNFRGWFIVAHVTSTLKSKHDFISINFDY